MATDMVPMFVCMFRGCFLVSDWCGRFKVAFVIIPLDEGGYRVKKQILNIVHEFATRCYNEIRLEVFKRIISYIYNYEKLW